MSITHQQMFRFMRFFSLTSLVSILVAAVLLASLYRQVAIQELINIGERGNVLLTQSVLGAVQSEIDRYLADEQAHHTKPFPRVLAQAIERLMQDTTVVMVSIIDDEGIVVFSSDADRIGEDRSARESYRTAIGGDVYSRFDFRDAMHLFSIPNAGDNVVTSHVPIRAGRAQPTTGVFTVETDVTPLVAEVEKAQLVVFAGSAGVMAVLYLVLLGVVHHAERVIRAQEETIRERSHALEQLSAQLISTQEDEKKLIAHELHEGVAQTLGGLKYRLEHACALLSAQGASTDPSLSQLVPLVQAAIQDVRALAMDIRPPSLDDLGVLSTLEWYCHELRNVHPHLSLRHEMRLREDEIPKPLKVVLFRVLQQMLEYLVRETEVTQVHIRLAWRGDMLRLEVRDDRDADWLGEHMSEDHKLFLMTLRERITLSGGSMDATAPNELNGTTVRVEWPI